MAGAAVPVALVALLAPVASAGQQPAGGDGTIYMAGYDGAIHIVDESTMQVVDSIAAEGRIPANLILSRDRTRFYSVSMDYEEIEIFDVAARHSIERHSFSSGDTRVRIWGITVHPSDERLMLVTSTDTKLTDRWDIGEPIIREYDLGTREFTREFPWPDGETREFASMMYSPDGSLLYFFANDLLVFDADTFEEMDKWEISKPFETGMTRLNLRFTPSLFEDEGFYTGLFNTRDPVNNRRLMGIARINLAEREVDFYTIGPSAGLSGFALSPDRTKAYSLRQQIGEYQMWTLDLENRRVESRRSFAGRPRMGISTSSNGELIYIHTAGNTIDIYEAATFEFVRTVELDADMMSFLVVPAGAGTP